MYRYNRQDTRWPSGRCRHTISMILFLCTAAHCEECTKSMSKKCVSLASQTTSTYLCGIEHLPRHLHARIRNREPCVTERRHLRTRLRTPHNATHHADHWDLPHRRSAHRAQNGLARLFDCGCPYVGHEDTSQHYVCPGASS